mmetsp:Transcript_4221/g.17829  ORF Transcript_4221/g.17829 Transcript_4221/m.17829 type:complete len:271 (+) Transcript_4221:575-1387(+)
MRPRASSGFAGRPVPARSTLYSIPPELPPPPPPPPPLPAESSPSRIDRETAVLMGPSAATAGTASARAVAAATAEPDSTCAPVAEPEVAEPEVAELRLLAPRPRSRQRPRLTPATPPQASCRPRGWPTRPPGGCHGLTQRRAAAERREVAVMATLREAAAAAAAACWLRCDARPLAGCRPSHPQTRALVLALALVLAPALALALPKALVAGLAREAWARRPTLLPVAPALVPAGGVATTTASIPGTNRAPAGLPQGSRPPGRSGPGRLRG